MKKYVFLVLALACLLVSCSVDQTLITPAQEGFSDMEYFTQDFTLRVELGGKKCVLLASGNLSITDEPKKMVGEMEQTLLGENLGTVKVSWEDGKLYTDGEKQEMSWEELRTSLLYAPPLTFDEAEIKSAETGNTLSGTLYRHYIKDNSKKVDEMVSLTKYTYAVSPMIYTKNNDKELVQLNPNDFMATLMGSSSSLMTTAGFSIFI